MQGRFLLLAILIAANAYFMIWWIIKMFGAGVVMLRKFPCLRKCVGTASLDDGYGDRLTVNYS